MKLETKENIAGFQYYEGVLGQKISWQDWIQNDNVDTVFFDNTKPNDNLNLKASNYSNLNDYSIRLALIMSVDGINDLGVSGTTEYLIMTQDVKIIRL